MTKDKDRGFYYAEYTCMNCGYKKTIQVEYGKTIPIFRYPVLDNKFMRQFVEEAPECDYCGCREWSDGKRPENL